MEDTIKFIEELERVAQAPMSLIKPVSTLPREAKNIDLRTVIDRAIGRRNGRVRTIL